MNRVFSILAFLIISISINGQGTGLVLSGGGAKGLAHIGVIEALETNNVKIDYIAGTSMGAVIASLYAMGYSPEEMRQLVKSDDFKRWSTGTIEPSLRFTYNQNRSDPVMFTVNSKKDENGNRPSMPAHLVPSEVIDFAMMELTCGANTVSGKNFDSLMVPFRCVASDIYNKKGVVFSSGNLARVVKASMAYPIYFEPVVIDSVLYFDGGIFNNFPSEVMIKDFHTDFIIGSKVVSRSKKPGKDDLRLQLENMIMQDTSYSIRGARGYVIQTNCGDVSLLDFDNPDSLITAGYRSATSALDSILPFVGRRSKDDVNLMRARFKGAMPDTLFGNIKIEGVTERQEEYIRNLLSKKERRFDIEQLKSEYFRLISEAKISQTIPEAEYSREDSCYNLTLNVKLRGSYSLSAGGLISMSTFNQFYIGFNYYSMSDILNIFSANVYLGQYYSSFKIAHRISVPQRKSLFVDFMLTGNRWNYFTNESPAIFKSLSSAYVVRNERFFRANISTPSGNNSLLNTGLSFIWLDDVYYISGKNTETADLDNSEYFYASGMLSFNRNTLNHLQFSTRGNKIDITGTYNRGFEYFDENSLDTIDTDNPGSQAGWFSFKIRNESYNRLGDRFSLGSLVDIRLSNRSTGHNYTSTLVNAYKFEPTPLSGLIFGRSLRANSYLGGGLIPNFELSNDLNLRMGMYVFAPVRKIMNQESGVIYSDYFPELSAIGEMALIYHTRIGPLSLGINYFSNEKRKLFYFLNFGYILFNSKGLE